MYNVHTAQTEGTLIQKIFEMHSIDLDILENGRMWGFAQNIHANADRDEGFEDLRKLTPSEFYQYLHVGVYPIPLYAKIPDSSPRFSALTSNFNALCTEERIEKSYNSVPPSRVMSGAHVVVEKRSAQLLPPLTEPYV